MSKHDNSGRAGLLEILSWARPHDSETEARFNREFLDCVPGMTTDGFGNRILRIGDLPVLWSCHVDTVSAKHGLQLIAVDRQSVASLANGKAGMSLGADDGAGVWIMLNMIAANRPGLYVFHRGEELGCLGSRWIVDNTPELLDGIQAAIAFDRAGFSDVITHQAGGRGCSDAFANSVAAALNGLQPGFRYEADPTGTYTDTNEYIPFVPECTNLSVGYHGQHGPRETLDVAHCEALLTAMLRLDAGKLTIERDPSVKDEDDDWWLGYRSFKPSKRRDPFETLVIDYPKVAVELLEASGLTMEDFEAAAWEWEMGGTRRGYERNAYRPVLS